MSDLIAKSVAPGSEPARRCALPDSLPECVTGQAGVPASPASPMRCSEKQSARLDWRTLICISTVIRGMGSPHGGVSSPGMCSNARLARSGIGT